MKRSTSLGGLKIIAESEEIKSRSFFKFPFFRKKKARRQRNTISGRPEQGIEFKNDKRRTLIKSLSTSCLSLTKIMEKETPKSERLGDCDLVTDDQNNNLNSCKTMEKNANSPSLTTCKVDLHTPPRELQTATDSPKRDSKIIATRIELEFAVNNDDINTLRSAIRSKTFDLNDKDNYDKTLLHMASSIGNYRCAQILINAGADVDMCDQAGFTPLHCAVVSNHVPCAAVLISAGANLVARTKTMHTPLTLAHEDEMILIIGRSLLLRGTTLL